MEQFVTLKGSGTRVNLRHVIRVSQEIKDVTCRPPEPKSRPSTVYNVFKFYAFHYGMPHPRKGDEEAFQKELNEEWERKVSAYEKAIENFKPRRYFKVYLIDGKTLETDEDPLTTVEQEY